MLLGAESERDLTRSVQGPPHIEPADGGSGDTGESEAYTNSSTVVHVLQINRLPSLPRIPSVEEHDTPQANAQELDGGSDPGFQVEQ